MSSQSIVSDYTISLQLVQKYLFQYLGSIIITFGSIGCLLSWIVFNKKTLRKNPCSIFMTAFHISNFAYIITLILPAVLSIGYGMTFIANTLSLCRFNLYMAFALDILSPSCLVLASIDRLLVTSPNALTRQRSTCRLAYISVICAALLWLLLHCHALILMYIIQLGPNIFICYTQSSIYLTIINYYTLIKNILVPSLLAGLGVLAIRNVRHLNHNRIVHEASVITMGNHRGIQAVHSKDRQLVRILLIDIGIYVICTYPQTAFNLYQQITQYQMRSVDQIQADASIQYLCSFASFIPYCIGLYSNLFVSKTFRNELPSLTDTTEQFTTATTVELTTVASCALGNSFLMGTTVFGSEIGTAGSSLSTLNAPWGITINNDDSMLIADNNNNRVLYVPANETTGIKVAPISASLYSRRAYFDSSYLYLFVIDSTRCQMTQYYNGSLTKTILFGTSCGRNLTQFNTSASFIMDSNGSFYIVDTYNHRIMCFPANMTSGIVVAGETGISGSDSWHLYNPQDIVLDESAGVYYVADGLNHRILRFSFGSSNGTIVAGGNGIGSGSNQLNGPCGIYLSKQNGTLYIADTNNNRIVRWYPECSEGVTIAGASNGTNGASPFLLKTSITLTMDKDEKYLYVADRANNRIQKFTMN
ncbi:hypothetical protein I4U23_004983 [Adineta vaga]|nr:hypothetical protein I4U23_004983 [Adineta vaga]